MKDEYRFIPGIDRYCDRWCERCPFASRCLAYYLEQSPGSQSAPDNQDVFHVAFWLGTDRALSEAMQFIGEQPSGAEGAGLHFSGHRSAREHPCSKAALEYAGMIDAWKDSRKGWPVLPEDAGTIIAHYCYFLYPKLVRAMEVAMVSGDSSGSQSVDEDAEGTAKTVLIAIDRSLAAWGMAYRKYPEHEDEVLAMLLHLDRLRKSVEAVFPAARGFRRLGLDD
jgi:hypothetical protein